MVNIETANTYAAKWTIGGWFVGLAYYNWFASHPPHVSLWGHVVLIIGGMFAASILIGGGMSLLASLITKIVTGRSDGSPNAFGWTAFISPVIAFFVAHPALTFMASL